MSTSKPYHHGNLRAEMLRVAVELGRKHGPDAVSIRAVTRAIGVSPTSAYRHFTDQEELLRAVADASIDELLKRLDAALIEAEDFAAQEEHPGPIHVKQLMHAAMAYLRFALGENGFFQCILSGRGFNYPRAFNDDLDMGASDGHSSTLHRFYHLLAKHAIDTDGTADYTHFPVNALAAWATVHGFSVLATSGHLSALPEQMKLDIAKSVFAASIRGTDFKNPENPYRNYPGSVRPEAQ